MQDILAGAAVVVKIKDRSDFLTYPDEAESDWMNECQLQHGPEKQDNTVQNNLLCPFAIV